MPIYKVSYSGFYLIEADSLTDAFGSDRDDSEVLYEEWENEEVCILED